MKSQNVTFIRDISMLIMEYADSNDTLWFDDFVEFLQVEQETRDEEAMEQTLADDQEKREVVNS